MDYHQLARKIVEEVGGEKNINTLAACATRLRFVLKDSGKTSKTRVESLEGVIAVVESGGMFQIVIGNAVGDVYRAVLGITNLDKDTRKSGESAEGEESLLNRAIATIASIFGPLFGVMAGAGLIKGLLALCVTMKWMVPASGAYQIWNAAGDSFFYFLPVILAVTSANKFKANQFIAMALAGALMYPSIFALYTDKVPVDFFGIPVILMKYSSTVIPIVLAVFVLAQVENFLKKKLHESVRNMLTPFLCLGIMVPLTLIAFGPIGTFMSNMIAAGFSWIYNLSPMLAGAIMGSLWQILVVFGVHWGITAVVFNNLAKYGYDAIGPLYSPSLSAQAGSALGVFLKTKNSKMKSASFSAMITAIFGITEPAIYGVNLKLKKPFIYACIAGAIGGGIAGAGGARAVSFVTKSIFTIPAFIGPGFMGYVIGYCGAFFLSLAMTYFLGFEDLAEDDASQGGKGVPAKTGLVKKEVISTPLAGKIESLKKVPDDTFSLLVMGRGAAIIPSEGKLLAPVNGMVEMVFPTAHAYGLRSDEGAEIMIHLGIDTVTLEGKHFYPKVKVGDVVKKGDLLAEFDLDQICKLGYNMISPVIITNTNAYLDVLVADEKEVAAGDEILTLMI